VGDLEQQPNGDTWVEYGGGPLDYEDMLAYLRSQQGECETWALIGAEDPGHVLRGSDPFVPDWYKEDGVCGYGLMNMVMRIYVDIAPFGIHEGFEGEEYIDWPDQNPPYEGSYACDNLAFSEREYFLYQMWEDTDAKFMKMRVTDSLGNWTRTDYLYHNPPSGMYKLVWHETDFDVGSYKDYYGNDYYSQRQYVNLEKNQGSVCEPINHGTRLCLKVKCNPPNDDYWVRFECENPDPPIIPQSSPAFPWPNPPDDNPNPHEGDNIGESGFPYPADHIDIQVPCDGIVEADFWTSTFGGDNYKIRARLYDGNPEGNGEYIDVETGWSPMIEVWRFLSVQIWAMAPKSGSEYPPDFVPNCGSVRPAFDEGYVQMYIYDGYQDLDNNPSTFYRASYGMLYENFAIGLPRTDWDYVDDFPPGGPKICDFKIENKYIEEKYLNPDFHVDFVECRKPSHTIQVVGFDRYLYPFQDDFGWNFPSLTIRDVHYHTFIAKGAIWYELNKLGKPGELGRATNKTVIHELGHRLVLLLDDVPYTPEDPHVMMLGYSFPEIPLKFHGTHLYKLRAGDAWFETEINYCANCVY